MQTNVTATIKLEAFHCWPKAAEVFPEVAFLADRHRHIFWFKMKKKVNHDDRDVEIIMLGRQVKRYLEHEYFSKVTNSLEFEHLSCEMLAKELVKEFDLEYCEVLEDGENGAEVWKITK